MKKSKKRPSTNKESQFVNITTLCDGYAQVDPEKIENFKDVYFYVIRDEQVLFPFIYKETCIIKGYPERTIINIRKNECIVQKEGKKLTSSL
jgi:hypothetical protein